MSQEIRRNAGSGSKNNGRNTTTAVLDLPDDSNMRRAAQGASASSEIARLSDRVHWLEAVLDAIPFPIHAIDLDMKWAFLNTAFEKLMLDNKSIGNRAEAVGLPCSTASADICNTEKCGIRQLVKTGLSVSHFDWHGTDCKQDTAKILSADGKHIGWVELVQDLTSTVRVKDYTNNEVTRLASNLVQIASGNIQVDLAVGAGDEYTKDAKAQFETISESMRQLRETISAVVVDTAMLADSGAAGKLHVRADATKHQGDFRKIVDGLNHTLDAVVGPIQEVDKVVGLMAKGDLTQRIEREYAGDFNQLKAAVNTLSIQFGEAIRQIGKETTSLVASSSQLNQVSQQMGASADETSTQANVVSAAAEEVSKNVQTVATGADEMGASIKEIAKSTAEATRVANMAVKTAGTTNQTITKLGQSSAEIGQVIKVITSIAQQTNLLALNATIEAARAGEAGKGFAVVANEVKELAKETAKATEDISQKIEAIQSDTKGAVSAIGEISGVIAQISDIQNTIASAIEEQSATTNEIIRNLAEAAKGSTDISRNIGGVAEAAHTTSAGASETQQSAKSLEKMSAELEVLVSRFKV